MNNNQDEESNLERRRELQHDQEAFLLHQEENRLGTARRSSTFIWLVNSIYWLVGVLQIVLVIRLLLRLFGANRKNAFAELINQLSAPFVAPFSTLFVSPTSGSGANIFDLNIVIAIIVYSFLGYLAVSLVRFIYYRR
jgi:uncharacterized protein YggT (Ycf19 family)